MAKKYKQSVNSAQTRFTTAPMGELEFSTWRNRVRNLTTFNAGDIVPIFDMEILPHDTISMDLDYVIRQATISVPTMDVLNVDFYAFFVPNRVVNKSWKNVMGENSSGAWSQSEPIVLAPLAGSGLSSVPRVPIGSVADYYGYPTQEVIPVTIWQQMHDLKARGYLEIYNTYFRDQNYQPPIPYSKLNVYNGFLSPVNTKISLTGAGTSSAFNVSAGTDSSGQFGGSAIVKEIGGDGYTTSVAMGAATTGAGSFARLSSFNFLGKPLKANKLHDYFTSVLPSPQKGRQVVIPLSGNLQLNTSNEVYAYDSSVKVKRDGRASDTATLFGAQSSGTASEIKTLGAFGVVGGSSILSDLVYQGGVNGSNLVVDASNANISLDDIRLSAGLQQVYEILGRGGSRYTEYINSFFGLDIDNPFDDIPTYLGHFRNELDLYQTAQTSATTGDSGTPQGNLSAFGYTSKSGKLFTRTFKEHGYLHILCVVRQKNTYASYLGRDNFRLNMMDFYQYPLANISEQPVYTREINPFSADTDGVWGYQEAWSEYRMLPDRVSGYLRPQPTARASESLEYWTYADKFDKSLLSANGDWLVSNAEEVVSDTIALQDSDSPQFKGQFFFNLKIERAMPTYSVAGLDII